MSIMRHHFQVLPALPQRLIVNHLAGYYGCCNRNIYTMLYPQRQIHIVSGTLVLRRCTNVARLCKERKIWIIHGCMVIFPQTFLKQQGICPVCRVDFVTSHSVHYLFPSHTRKVPKNCFRKVKGYQE